MATTGNSDLRPPQPSLQHLISCPRCSDEILINPSDFDVEKTCNCGQRFKVTLQVRPITGIWNVVTVDIRRLTTSAYHRGKNIWQTALIPAFVSAYTWVRDKALPFCTQTFSAVAGVMAAKAHPSESDGTTGPSNTPTFTSDDFTGQQCEATAAIRRLPSSHPQANYEYVAVSKPDDSALAPGQNEPNGKSAGINASNGPEASSSPTKLFFPNLQRPERPKQPTKPDSPAPTAVVCRFGQGDYLNLAQATENAPKGSILRVKRGSYSVQNISIRKGFYAEAESGAGPVVLESGRLVENLNDSKSSLRQKTEEKVVFNGFHVNDMCVDTSVDFINCRLSRIRIGSCYRDSLVVTFTNCVVSEFLIHSIFRLTGPILLSFVNCHINGMLSCVLAPHLAGSVSVSVVVDRCSFTNGGIDFSLRHGALWLSNCTFSDCSAPVSISAGTAIIENSTINAYQTAVSMKGESQVLLTDCQMSGGWLARASTVVVDQYSLVRIIACKIEGVQSAILVLQGMADIERCVIRGSRTGAIFNSVTTGRIADCDLRQNKVAASIAAGAQVIWENVTTDPPPSQRTLLDLLWSKLQTKIF